MQSVHKHPLAARLAFWAAFLTAATFIVFTVCFVVVYTQAKSSGWTNITEFAAQSRTGNPFFKLLAQSCMVLFGPLYVVIINSLGAMARPERKVLAHIAADFGLAFAVLSSMHYFVQITMVRWNVASGQLGGLEPFVQSNPASFILAANMLGWTLFFGLSSLFAAYLFDHQGIQKISRAALLVNGITCLVGGAGFLLQNTGLVFVTMNFLMGGAVLVFAIGLCVSISQQLHEVNDEKIRWAA